MSYRIPMLLGRTRVSGTLGSSGRFTQHRAGQRGLKSPQGHLWGLQEIVGELSTI